MDSLTGILLTFGAPITVLLLLVLAVLSFLMPFFIWRASSDIREIRTMLSKINYQAN